MIQSKYVYKITYTLKPNNVLTKQNMKSMAINEFVDI